MNLGDKEIITLSSIMLAFWFLLPPHAQIGLKNLFAFGLMYLNYVTQYGALP
jgi:hypothetical protein